MVLYTPIRNLPYVQPADTVTSYPVTSQDLATKLDATGAFIQASLPTTGTFAAGGTQIPFSTVVTVAGTGITLSGSALQFASAGTYLVSSTVYCYGPACNDVFMTWTGSNTRIWGRLKGSPQTTETVFSATRVLTLTGAGSIGVLFSSIVAGWAVNDHSVLQANRIA